MSASPNILVVDDTALNRKLLVDLLEAKGYAVRAAACGGEALGCIEAQHPDLILLDVVMPDMSGYDVCAAIRGNPETKLLPVVMVTALESGEERVKSIEVGADDFLTKPINTEELLARVRSLLRIKALHDTVSQQAAELAQWNRMLEARVQEQVAELGRLGLLKRFLPPQLAELIAESGMAALQPHRRRIVVAFVDLRGFTAFAESAEPEEVMEVLTEYHAAMGRLVVEYEATLERFTGDGMVIVFNDPVELPNPEGRAVCMALAMRDVASALRERWLRLGHDIDVGIGMSVGYSTLGMIGFEGRRDYASIGSVMNQAARLCEAACGGQVLISERLLAAVESYVESECVGELALKGFRRPVVAHNLVRARV